MTPTVEDRHTLLLAQIARWTEETARWTKELARQSVRDRAQRLLDTPAKRRAYDAMHGGKNTLTAIGRHSGSHPSRDVKPWIEEWEAEGLIEQGSSPSRATFTLRELGIERPPAKTGRRATGGTAK